MDINFNNPEEEDNNNEDEELNNELSDMENELIKEKKKNFFSKVKIVKERLEEYEEAYNYFNDYAMHRRVGDVEKLLKQIKLIKEQLKVLNETER